MRKPVRNISQFGQTGFYCCWWCLYLNVVVFRDGDGDCVSGTVEAEQPTRITNQQVEDRGDDTDVTEPAEGREATGHNVQS